MSKLSETLSGSITQLTASDLDGATKIYMNRFMDCTKLTSVDIPEGVTEIMSGAFCGCPISRMSLPSTLRRIEYNSSYIAYGLPSCTIGKTGVLLDLDSSKVPKDANIPGAAFLTEAFSSFPVLMGAGDSILWKNEAGATTIPTSVRNICGDAIRSLASTVTSFVVPDFVEILGGNVAPGSSVTKVTVGAGVTVMRTGVMGNTAVTTWVFRQPAGVTVELPTPGDGTGLGYKKDSRSITIYTDNESIKNYNWSGDNITPTIYPLADAPA